MAARAARAGVWHGSFVWGRAFRIVRISGLISEGLLQHSISSIANVGEDVDVSVSRHAPRTQATEFKFSCLLGV